MLDNVPLATPAWLASAVIIVIAYLSNDLTAFQALAAFGVTGLGAGALGHARNGAGRGLR
jgi:hypothetical protein